MRRTPVVAARRTGLRRAPVVAAPWPGLRRALVALVAAGAFAAPARAQYSLGTGAEYMGYSFDPGLGAESARLLLVPVALRLPVTPSLTFDVYAAWAEGRVEQSNVEYSLSGPVDTSVKLSLRATPWALVSLSANLPTGDATHDADEAVVASVLSTDLLSFRESTWGSGFALTSSVATATTAGGFGIGIAGAYALRNEFEPDEGTDVRYKPGSEMRVRVGVDRNFGTATLTTGATFIDYAADEADGINLFQAGRRLRFDTSLAFRAGEGVWTIYAADVIREHGDLRLDVADPSIVGDSTLVTAKQNMIVGGLIGTVGLGGGFVIRPHLDFKYQLREEADGSDSGTGWIFSAGGDLPLRVFGGTEFFPKARVFFGTIRSLSGGDVNLVGLELKGTLRWIF